MVEAVHGVETVDVLGKTFHEDPKILYDIEEGAVLVGIMGERDVVAGKVATLLGVWFVGDSVGLWEAIDNDWETACVCPLLAATDSNAGAVDATHGNTERALRTYGAARDASDEHGTVVRVGGSIVRLGRGSEVTGARRANGRSWACHSAVTAMRVPVVDHEQTVG